MKKDKLQALINLLDDPDSTVFDIVEKELLKEIETNLGKPISRLVLTKDEYDNTLIETKEVKEDWKSLLTELDEIEERKRKKSKKRRGLTKVNLLQRQGFLESDTSVIHGSRCFTGKATMSIVRKYLCLAYVNSELIP